MAQETIDNCWQFFQQVSVKWILLLLLDYITHSSVTNRSDIWSLLSRLEVFWRKSCILSHSAELRPASCQTPFIWLRPSVLDVSKRPFWLTVLSFLFHVGFSCSSWQPCTNQQTVSHKSLCGFPEAECTLYFKENNQGKTCSGLTLLAGHSPDCCLFRNFRNCLALVWDPWISPKKDL